MWFGCAAALALQPDPAMLRQIYEDALARREKQFGVTDIRTARAASDLGLFLREQGDRAGAHTALATAVRVDEKALGATAPTTLADAADLASVSAPAEAEELRKVRLRALGV